MWKMEYEVYVYSFSGPVGFVTKLLLLMVISDYFSVFFAYEIIFGEGDQLVPLSLLDAVACTFKHVC